MTTLNDEYYDDEDPETVARGITEVIRSQAEQALDRVVGLGSTVEQAAWAPDYVQSYPSPRLFVIGAIFGSALTVVLLVILLVLVSHLR